MINRRAVPSMRTDITAVRGKDNSEMIDYSIMYAWAKAVKRGATPVEILQTVEQLKNDRTKRHD